MENLNEVVIAAQQGDENAFNQLYEEYHRLVFYIALKMTHSNADAQEVMQEVFIQIHKSISQLREPHMIKGWISQITANKCKHIFRKNNLALFDDDVMSVIQNQAEEDYLDYLPEEVMHYQNDVDVIHTCIRHLSEKYQTVIIYYYFEQMSIKEISEKLNIPNGTVKTRLLYAKQYLKSDIERYVKENEIAITFRTEAWESIIMLLGGAAGKHILTASPFFLRHGKTGKSFLVAKSCIAISVIGGITVAVSHSWNQRQQQISLQQTSLQHPIKQESTFPGVMYQNQWIHTPKEAYLALLTFAHCEVEMKEHTEAELKEIQPVYEALKAYDEGYFHLLQRDQWDGAFEKNLK